MIDNVTIGDRLQEARRALGLTQGEVGKQVSLAISTISEIESGKRSVTGAELHAFARLYHRPITFFFTDKGEDSRGFQYLFREADHQLLDRKAIVALEELARDYAQLEELVGAVPLPPPPNYAGFGLQGDDDAEALAEMERGRLNIGDAPIPDLMDFLDGTVGVRTFFVPVERQSWSGLVVRDAHGRPCIGVNAREESYRRNFDMAHEYAHVLTHLARQGATEGRIDIEIETVGRSSDERFANAFAAAFLMPRRAVLARLDQVLSRKDGHFTNYDLVHLAMRFGVSGQALASRLASLRRLPRSAQVGLWRKASFKALALSLGYPVEDWGDQVVVPPRYRYLATKAHSESLISLAKLAQLLREDYHVLRERLAPLALGQQAPEAD